MHCTIGVIKICALIFRELLSLGCINLENLCAHLQEDLLSIPKLCKLGKKKCANLNDANCTCINDDYI